MTEYFLPAGYGQSEFIEKKSRFLGQVWPVDSEPEAQEKIDTVKRQHHDARHNCWCYLLRDGTIRYSDDGEPQGTAGRPMLETFTRGGITNAVCVVTRYFGGVLLGTGGLVRAYSKSARDALSAAGISTARLWSRISLTCSYELYSRVRQETEKHGGFVERTDFGADVSLTVLIPENGTEQYCFKIRELSAGLVQNTLIGQTFQSCPAVIS